MTSLEIVDRTEIELIKRDLQKLEWVKKQDVSKSSNSPHHIMLTKEIHYMYDFLEYIKSDPSIFIIEEGQANDGKKADS